MIDYSQIDSPIRDLVYLMNEKGFETFYSCASTLYEGVHQYSGSQHLYIIFKGPINKLAKLATLYNSYGVRWEFRYYPHPDTLEERWEMAFYPNRFELPKDQLMEISDSLIKIAKDFFIYCR